MRSNAKNRFLKIKNPVSLLAIKMNKTVQLFWYFEHITLFLYLHVQILTGLKYKCKIKRFEIGSQRDKIRKRIGFEDSLKEIRNQNYRYH